MAKPTSFLLQFTLLVCFTAIHGRAEITSSSCDAYVSYFTKSSQFFDLHSISKLFGVKALKIAKASNLESDKTPLFDGQLLFIPVTCNSTTNGNNSFFFSNTTYKINQGDTFYLVSTSFFEHLCDSDIVVKMNPSLNPNNLSVGVEAVFPLFCKCPSKENLEQGIQFFITYVWQLTDVVSGVRSIFNVSKDANLEDVKGVKLTNFVAGEALFIPLSKLPLLSQSPPQRKKIKHLVIVVGGVALGVGFLLVAYVFFIYKKMKLPIWGNSIKMKMKQNGQLLPLPPPPVVSDYLGRPILYDYKVIMDATMSFNEGFKIGKSVYKAIINGQISVIKEAKPDSTEELMILQKVNHINLVKLVGFSSDDKENFYLVYEFAENGSLDKWLYSSSEASSSNLTWSQRLNIALDVANGLQYMHDHTQPSIVHQDIKTSCILLDLRFRAKISNLAKARPAVDSLSTKVDVFAFGVVVLKLLSGKKALKYNEEGREDKLRDWMDSKLKDCYPIEGALSLAVMARACTQDEPLSRPSMAEIVFNLCVLAESSPEKVEKSWVSLLEADEIGHSHSPIRAR
ncbi:serine/threonine receptor-like kinase NFP [Cucumis sativus]|uniref:serine/threonine receptor-like kinase NFP n=1 Tax=Cucumis sativus TaxID=3659 RepID=UPI0012F4C4D1|nr:serine/threonine receptor-like kinase NFP [Cucumis sativus]